MVSALRLFPVLLALVLASFASAQDPNAPPADDPFVEWEQKFDEGIAALTEGRYDEGIAAFTRCLEIAPEDPTCAYNIACGHSLKEDAAAGLEWLGKSMDWGFVYPPGNLEHLLENDTDLDHLRAAEGWEALAARATALVTAAEEYAATPATFVPEALAEAESAPLLVVLHDDGSTKDEVLAGPWRRVAEALGYALLAPSGRVPTGGAPAEGMSWASTPGGFAANAAYYQRPILDAVAAFRKDHTLDRARVVVVGEGTATAVAFHVATQTPGLYKGCVLHNGHWNPALADRAEHALGRGLRVRTLFEAGRTLWGFTPAADAELVRRTLQTHLTGWGYPDPVRTYRLDPEDPDALHAELVAEIEALSDGL